MAFSATSTDLTECDREPIHLIHRVQAFGAMLVLTDDWLVTQWSANCNDLLDLGEDPQRGQPLQKHFIPRAMDLLREALFEAKGYDRVERLFGLRLTKAGDLFDVAIHVSDGRIILECEPHAIHHYPDHIAMIGPAMSRLEALSTIDELCESTAIMARDMLRYDRVMVYRFHADDSGEVVAESKRDGLEPYLGLRYPKADIPQQARRLFQRNRVRVIADMEDEGVPLLPASTLEDDPVDLSLSVLRAHSTMHLQYMKNMGVKASLAIAIVCGGRLWGMISCHHYEKLLPPYSLRTVAEMLSQMFSLMLDRHLIAEKERARERGQRLHEKLMLRFAEGGDMITEALPLIDKSISDLIEHDGASIFINGMYDRRGFAPSEEEFQAIVPALCTGRANRIIFSENLASKVPESSIFQDTAAGALIIPISRSPRDFFCLWRKPLVKSVTWAGNPEKAVANPNERLQPRGSFDAWQQTVKDKSQNWTETEIEAAEGLRVTLLEIILKMSDEVARERSRAQEKQTLLIAELNHRVRNILGLIKGLVAQSQHDAQSVADFSRVIGGRISALASAHDNITRENWSPAKVSNLIRTEVEAYLSDKRERLVLEGEDVLITPEAYTVLALVIHELVTNSAKYGSLCDSAGSLDVKLARNQYGDLAITWREKGGPPVKPPTRRGFGTTIIEESIPHELRGEAYVRHKLSGLEADFVIPNRFVMSDPGSTLGRAGYESDTVSGATEPATISLPQNVLLVEDSMIIALDTEEGLRELGIQTVTVANGVESALAAIEKRVPDFALVDYNLGDSSSLPVLEKLKQLGVPFVLATGYTELGDELESLGAFSLLRKPYNMQDVEEALRHAL